MKKFVIFVLILGIFQYRNSISDYFSGNSDYQPATDGIVLYATEWCGYCEKTRELFDKHDIPYVEYDIEKSEQGYREYKKLGGSGVPVVNAYGTIIHGYSSQQILAAAQPN
jgi:glutaredoxin